MPLTKSKFRENCLKTMKAMQPHQVHYANAKINTHLSHELLHLKNKKILFYYPLGFEADILKTLKKCRKNNQIFVPFMEGESFKMVPFRLPLRKKKFGIFEAGNTFRNIKNIDIAIVPVVGVDKNLQRVGFGKGMYDRFFARLHKRPYIIFVQPKICFTKESICDAYDIACDLLITPKLRLENKGR